MGVIELYSTMKCRCYSFGFPCVSVVLVSERSGSERDWSGTLGSEEGSGFVVLSGLGRASDQFFFGRGGVSMSDWVGVALLPFH